MPGDDDATSHQPLHHLVRQTSKRVDPVTKIATDVHLAVRRLSMPNDVQMPVDPMAHVKAKHALIKQGDHTTYVEFLERIVDQPSLEAAMNYLASSPNGLTIAERQAREGVHGLNIAVEPMSVPPFITLWLAQWKDFIVLLLLASGIAMAFLGEIPACVMIALILGANASVGAVMEYKGLKQLAALINSEKSEVTAMVGGSETTVDTAYLFPGDVIQLSQGSKVPADCFILQTKSEGPTRSDANLNGESEPIELTAMNEPGVEAESQFPCNAIAAGSVMLTGTVVAMVFQTGKKTMAGQTQMSMASGGEEDPETTKKVDALITKVGYVSILAGVTVFAAGMITQQGGDPNKTCVYPDTDPKDPRNPDPCQDLWLQLLMIGVSLIAAAVPEGLPVVKVIVMAKAMVSMSENHAQMRSTKATENSAGITILCSDKTGTLTEGVMTLTRLIVGGTQRILLVARDGAANVFKITADGRPFDPRSHTPGEEQDNMMGGFSVLMNQCDAASTFAPYSGEWTSTGSSNFIDIASSRFNASALGKSLSTEYSDKDIAVDHPFDSAVKFAATVYKKADGGYVVIMKGASDKPDFEQFMTQADMNARNDASDEGLRLLALLTRNVTEAELGGAAPKDFFAKARILEGLKFAGFAAYQDPPRQDAKEAVACCRLKAGIMVKMITGDNPRTALSIAKQIGIALPDATLENGVIHMQDPLILGVFTEHAALELAKENFLSKAKKQRDAPTFTAQQQATLDAHSACIGHWITTRNVVARALPLHKRTLVKTLQNLGEIVAMTGDGVNDAAALKAAHLGVAMDNGADVTKEAADMVLRDCKFSTIVNVAIKGGRVISVNLKKFIYLLGSTNIAEVLIFIFGIFMGLPAPATAILVLYINLITDSIVALALGLEPEESAVMDEGPANPKEPLIGRAMWIRIVLHTVWSTVMFLGYYMFMLNHYTGSWDGVTGVDADPEGCQSELTRIHFVCPRGEGITGARTALVMLIVSSEMLRGYTAKNFDTNDWRFNNPLLNFSVFSGIALTAAIAAVPGINTFFSLGGSMDKWGWIGSLGLSVTVFPVDALLKKFVPRKRAFHTHKIVHADKVPNGARYGLTGAKSPTIIVTIDEPGDDKKTLLDTKTQV